MGVGVDTGPELTPGAGGVGLVALVALVALVEGAAAGGPEGTTAGEPADAPDGPVTDGIETGPPDGVDVDGVPDDAGAISPADDGAAGIVSESTRKARGPV